MSINWDMICSVVTAGVAIVALLVSIAQIRLSNKQQLLDRRLRLWTKAYGLMELCEKNRSSLAEKADEPEFANNLVFQWMTNNSLLCDIGPAVGHVLEQEWQFRLLVKLEELKEMAFEIELVFRRHPAKALSTFVEDYASLLMSMYQYQVMLKYLDRTREQFHCDLEKAISATGEEGQRDELHEARDKLLNSFDELSPRTVKRIISQCRLLWFS